MDEMINSGYSQQPSHSADESVSLWDVLLILVRNGSVILKTVGITLILGLLLAIFSPVRYSASVSVVKEIQSGLSGSGLSGLSALRGVGINLGMPTKGLTTETYSNILKSRAIRLAIVRQEISSQNYSGAMTFFEYHFRSKSAMSQGLAWLGRNTIELPGRLLRLFRPQTQGTGVADNFKKIAFPTLDEEEVMEALYKMVAVKDDPLTGIMTITVSSPEPYLSVQLVNRFVDQLQKSVRAIYSNKSRENLEFIQARLDEADDDLRDAEEMQAQFLDRNRDPSTAQLRMRADRFERVVYFKTSVYSELQTQFTRARIELQKSQPVITILDAAVPPFEPSKPKRKLLVMLALMIGIFFGIGLALVRHLLNTAKSDPIDKPKIDEISQSLKRLLPWA